MPLLVKAMASGFGDDARFDLAVLYGRIAFPYILFISLAALLSGVLNATGRFLAAAAAPVLLNVVFIIAICVGSVLSRPAQDTSAMLGLEVGNALVLAVPLGGIAQLGLVWLAARRAGFCIGLRRPRLTPDLRRLAIIAGPAALAGGVMQINLLVGRQVASYFDGAIAWLSYADRLYQLPLGVVGIAIGIVLLPDLSRRLAADDTTGGRDAVNRAAEFGLLLTVPAAVALCVIAGPIVSVLYQRGAFGEAAAQSTALVTAIYGLGLPAFVLQKVLQPLYFARSDTRTPFYFAVVSMGVNAAIAIGFAPVIGFTAAAWATTLAGWAMFGLLWWGSRSMGDAARTDQRLRRRTVRVLLASALMGAVLLGLSRLMEPLLQAPGLRYPALLALILAGIASYMAAAQLLGAASLAEIRRAMRRTR